MRSGVTDRLKFWLQSRYDKLILIRDLLLKNQARIETSSRCQLSCPACPTGQKKNREGPVGWGNLSADDFATFLRDHPYLNRVELSNWGEPLLNPEFPDILREAHQAGVDVRAANGVNLNHATDDALDAIVRYRLRYLMVSIDGVSEASYREYRRGGSLARVFAHIETINQLKRRYRSPYPRMGWQFIIFGHNEHELESARMKARQLGMDFHPKLQAEHWLESYSSPVKDNSRVSRLTGLEAANRSQYREKHRREFFVPCTQLWAVPQVNWDGRVLGCCDNRWRDFGNAFESGLEAIAQTSDYRYTKRMLLGLEPPDERLPCTRCHHYHRRSLESLVAGGGILEFILRRLLTRDS